MSQFGSILVGLGLRTLMGKMSEESRKREIQVYVEAWDKLFSPQVSALLNMMTETLTKQIGSVSLEWDVVKKASEWLTIPKATIRFGITDYTAFEATFYAITDIMTQEYPDMAQALEDIEKKLMDLLAEETKKKLEELKSS